MKFLLIGCNGKMGKAIIRLAKDYNDIVVCGIDINKDGNLKTYLDIFDVEEEVDAIIDFSTTENHVNFIRFAQTKKIPYGLFSTIVNKETQQELKQASKHIPVLHCKNASVGINLIYELLEICSKKLPTCETVIQEYHHTEKIDKPSGTAKEFEKILSNNNVNFSTHAYRVGSETGTHIIQFFLKDEVITLSHNTHSRDVFARGAILAMHNLKEKENNLYFSP